MALHSRPPARHLTAHYSGTCAILWALMLLCNMQPTLPCKVSGVQLVLTEEEPLHLYANKMAVARFVCNITGVNITKSSINWFAAYNDSGPKKIGDSATRVLGRFSTSWDEVTGVAELNITALDMSDSGEYYCKFMSFSSKCLHLLESNKVWLNITGELKTPWLGRPTNKFSPQTVIILVVLLGALAILCALIIFMFLKRRRGNTKPGGGTLPVEKEAPDAPIYTVEYSVLEFQKKAERLNKVRDDSNVEYATIVFPPSLSETRDWRLS